MASAPPVPVPGILLADAKLPGVLFLTGFVLAGLVYGAVVYAVNPIRDFAEGPGVFPAVRSDYRSEKIELLDRFLASGGPVDGLILGSSRSMLLSGERLGSLTTTGDRYFNFGLASAKGEDFLAALRWTVRKQHGHMPHHVIIGVDVESLRDAKAHGDSIHALRELATGEPAGLDRWQTLLSRTVTWSYARDTAFSVYLKLFPRTPAVQFAADGTLRYAARDASRAAGSFSIEPGMAGCMADCRSKIESTATVSKLQAGYLRQTVREALDGGAEVTLWLTGPHPRTIAHMSEGTAYLSLVTETWNLLRSLDPAVRVIDLHDPSSYGGDTGGWYDCNHFGVAHAIRVERMLTAVSAAATKGGTAGGF